MINELVYVLLAVSVFLMNMIPAFMPPTWLLLAFFYIHFKLQIIPVVLIGAICATSGRIMLSKFARNYLRRWIPKKYLHNYNDLGAYFKTNQKLTIPVVIMYAFLPIPSNEMFIIAGLTRLNIRLIAASFFVGRLISYSFWVSVAYKLSEHVEDIFVGHLSNTHTIVTELLSFSLIFIIGQIPWGKILKLKTKPKIKETLL